MSCYDPGMTTGTFQVLSRGRDAVVLVGPSGELRMETTGCAKALMQSAQLHEGAQAPLAHTLEVGENWVTFGPPFAVSFSAIIEGILCGELPALPYCVATAFVEALMAALELAHQGGLHFKTLGPSNIYLSSEGEVCFVGLGGLQLGSPSYCTPEVGLGEASTVGSDLYAASQVLRQVLPAVDLPTALRRLYSGRPNRTEAYFWKQLVRIDRVLGSANPAARRLTVAGARKIYHGFWQLVGVEPNPQALRDYATSAAAILNFKLPLAIYDGRANTLELGEGRTLDLAKHPVQARLLAVLIACHFDDGCSGLSSEELIVRVWPDEKIMQQAARNRFYVAISKLRKAGLDGLLLRDEEGRYGLHAEMQVEQRRRRSVTSKGTHTPQMTADQRAARLTCN